jgi:hypothetical protein
MTFRLGIIKMAAVIVLSDIVSGKTMTENIATDFTILN